MLINVNFFLHLLNNKQIFYSHFLKEVLMESFMRISPVSNVINSFSKNSVKNVNGQRKTSFKGIYVEDIVDLGDVAEGNFPPEFLKKDALLLNEIAQEYPNQDCFIRKGYAGLPRLEYRERPPQVQMFTETIAKQYKTSIDPNDEEYPSEPLILYGDTNLNRFIGMTSFISLNPSLPYTVKVGFELHKKLLEKKYQIMEVIGKTDNIDLGDETLIQKAHKAIEDIEIAVVRYLMESSCAALSDRASASQIYASNYPKVQSRLDAKRHLDLVTSVAKRPELDLEEIKKNKIDICDLAVKNYPNTEENKARIEELAEYMTQNGLIIG